MQNRQLTTFAVCAGVVLTHALLALASPSVFYGRFVSYKSEELTVVDDRGQKESFRINKDTVVTSREGGQRLDRVRPGARLNVSATNGTAKSVVILEVPK